MTNEEALARILFLVDRQGDGETLGGRDPGVVVDVVGKRLGLREQRRRKGVRRRSAKRAASVEARRSTGVPAPECREPVVDGEDHGFRVFVSNLACAIELTASPMGRDPCHLKTRRNSGDWVEADDGELAGNLFPARRRYHTEQHSMPVADFEARHRVDLAAVCRVVGQGYLLGLEPEELSEAARLARGYERVDLEAWRDRGAPMARFY